MIWLVVIFGMIAVFELFIIWLIWKDIGRLGASICAAHNTYREMANDETRNPRDRSLALGRMMAYDSVIRLMIHKKMMNAIYNVSEEPDEPSDTPSEAPGG